MNIEHLKLNHGGSLYTKEAKLMRSNYKDPKIIFDIGANVGGFSVELSKQFPDSFIFAFEPAHDTFKLLQSNTENYENITCYNFGFYDKDKYDVGMGMPDISNKKTHNYGRMTIHYTSEKLDSVILKGFSNWCIENKLFPDMLKIDVEGCEINIITNAMEANLIKDWKLIYIEINNSFDGINDVLNILDDQMNCIQKNKLNYLYTKKIT